MKKSRWYSIIVVAVIGIGYFLFWNSGDPGYTFRTETIARGEIAKIVRATGTINPLQTVKVGSQVSGRIAELYVDFNSEVKAGQIVAVIDSTFLSASVRESEANLQRVQAQLNESERSLKRTRELFAKDLVAQAELDASLTAYETSVAQMKQAEASLERARVNLRYAVIRSPIDGVVISRDVDVGQTVAASLQAPQLVSIANDLKKMQVEASVDEADIGQIKPGLTATFAVDSYPDEEFTGTVVQVRLSPVTLQNVVTYTVIIGVPNPELKLRPGMTATASILIDKREEALRLPAIALRFQPPADLPEHYTQQDEERAGDTTAGTVGEAPIERDKKSGGGGDRAPGERRRRPRDGGGEADTGSGRRDRGSGEMGKRPDTDGDGMRSGSPGGSNRDRMAGMSGGKSRRGGGRRGSSATVWVLGEDQKIRKVRVRTGLSDMRYVEVLGGELEEGDMVVLGAMAGDNPGSRGTTNPFQQQRGGRRMR